MPTLSDNLVYFSVTNTIDDEKRDLNTPFSFLDFLKYTGSNDKDIELVNYQQYLQDWSDYTGTTLGSLSIDIKTQFITFLSEIKLLFFNNEEKRYFDNIDLNNNEQLCIAVPFFTSKIKEIALYFKKKRSSITGNLEYVKRKGTSKGVDRFIKDQILDIYSGDDVPPGLNTRDETIEEFINAIDVSYERIYDTFNDYYDLSPDKSPTFYDTVSGDRFDNFTSNTNTISSSFYTDEDQAIIDIINSNGVGLEEIPGLSVTYNEADLSLLPNNEFLSYQNTGDRDDLNYTLTKDIPVNYQGTDMYYISSNDTDYVLDELFTSKFPHRNLLNINNPSTLTVYGDSFKGERSVGLFFKPSVRGMLKMECDFTSYIISDDIDSNTTYIIPNPARYGKIEGVGGQKRDNPLIFNSTFNRFKNISSSFGKSLPEADSKDQTFHSYNTLEQRLFVPNNDVPLTKLEQFNLDGTVYKETGDIFGNEFYIVNPTNQANKNLDNFVPTIPPLNRLSTQTTTQEIDDEKETLASIRHKDKEVEVFNIIKNEINPISSEFGAVFDRYSFNTVLYDQLTNSKFQDIDIFETVFFIKTKNYFIIDNIVYQDGSFVPQTFAATVREYNAEIIIDQQATQISNFSNPVRINNEIFYIKLTSDKSVTSPTNLKFFEFDLFKFDKNTKREINLISSNTQNQSYFADNFTFNLDTNIVEITNISFSYNSKQGKFIAITNFRDMNHACFIHVLIFEVNGNALTISENYIIAPDNFSKTINFYSAGSFINNFDYQSITTTPTRDGTYGTLRF